MRFMIFLFLVTFQLISYAGNTNEIIIFNPWKVDLKSACTDITDPCSMQYDGLDGSVVKILDEDPIEKHGQKYWKALLEDTFIYVSTSSFKESPPTQIFQAIPRREYYLIDNFTRKNSNNIKYHNSDFEFLISYRGEMYSTREVLNFLEYQAVFGWTDNQLDQYLGLKDNIRVEYDDFDEHYKVYFDSNSSIEVRVISKASENDIALKIGTNRKTWLFWTDFKAKARDSHDSIEHSFNYDDVFRLQNRGWLEEFVYLPYTGKLQDFISSAENGVIVRFYSDKMYDEANISQGVLSRMADFIGLFKQ